jgi:hypothetical protein
MKLRILAFFLLFPVVLPGLAQSADETFGNAQRAWTKKDYPAFLDIMSEITRQTGRHPSLLQYMARAHALNGDSAASLNLLTQLSAMRLAYRPDKDTTFASLADSPRFRRIVSEMVRHGKPALRSQAGFIIRDAAFIPEGITWDPVGKTFFVGSLAKRKILRIDAKGQAKDFTRRAQDGLWEVLGMKVEPQKRLLWVCSADEKTGQSGLFLYDLKTSSLIKKYVLEDTTRKHLLNDLTLLENGDIYLTDSEAATLYRLDRQTDKLETVNPQARLIYPNGITHREEGRLLYVAHYGGIVVIDLILNQTTPLVSPPHITLAGMDGLYFHENTLIGVQNGIGSDRVVQFFLSPEGKSVTGWKVLENNHPNFKIPTTGVIVGKSFYFIANSQLRNLQPDGTLSSPETLKDVIVLQIKL